MCASTYRDIKDYVLARIHAGEWIEGDRVPSENELARKFNVARMTANRALRELTAERMLTRVHGSGTFVARSKYESTLVAIRSISDEVVARGHRHHASMLYLGASIANAALADEMRVSAGSPVFHSRVLHLDNDEPIQFEEGWVDPAVVPEYGLQDFANTTPSQYLMCIVPSQRVEYRIEAVIPGTDARALLGMVESEPCIVLHRRIWSNGLVASIAILWHPGHHFQFSGYF